MSSKEEWVQETWMFQRVAGIAESARDDLEADWDAMKPKQRKLDRENLRTSRIIQDTSVQAGSSRKS